MKVAVFTDTYLPQINGVTNTLNNLINYFETSGIEYKIFTPKYEIEQQDQNIESFHSIKFIFYPENRLAIPSKSRIHSILSEFQPDIIHIMTEFNLGLAGLNYGRSHGIPTITNYTTNFSQYTDYYKINFLKQPLWNYLKWFHTQSDLTLCPSETVRKVLHVHGIPNTAIFSRGIDFNGFHPSNRTYELRRKMGIEDKIAFLYVGRVSFEKDLDILCKSYQTICQTYKERVTMVITGEGPYLEKCKQMFPKDTIFTGYKKGKELKELYASCDIFTFPSSTETFGNVVLEAMASGIPIIGADAGGVGEIIKHRVTGLKFAERNAEQLTKYMAELIENYDLREYLKTNGREYSMNRSWDKIFSDLMEHYSEILKRKGSCSISA